MGSSDSNSKNKKDKDGIGNPDGNKDNNKNKKHDAQKGKLIDPQFKRIVWHLICSTRGGVNRAKILHVLTENPSNANQISTQLKLDYKTITHHIDVLKKNRLIITENEDSYGATYFTSPIMERNYFVLDEIMDRIGKK